GYHRRAGLAHAEIEALKGLDKPGLRGAVLYVTLEPCCHKGRTAACTSAIISSGVKKVVVGALDPNPLVSGKGIALLRAAGINVIEGVLAGKAATLNEWFEKFITTGLPFVRLKLAASLDGGIATSSGESKWITGQAARRYVHRLRAISDAVLVGSNTAVKDDPCLTVRHVRGRNPARVVLDSSFRTPLTARIFEDASARVYILTTAMADKEKVRMARSMGVKVFSLGTKRVNMRRAMKKLAQCGVGSLLIEGGGVVAASAIKAGLVDRVFYFISPVFLGSEATPAINALSIGNISTAPRLRDMKVRRLGGDLLVEGALGGRPPRIR
ncbi:MAG: bifunctional diaminohydroxyphosphoribosylaminopyrimidine deaminase/5-amino-6-(5-phosphoribosylamino)uracil reductase RibD, partial [Thermodesulfobacteriota bacterium]